LIWISLAFVDKQIEFDTRHRIYSDANKNIKCDSLVNSSCDSTAFGQ